MLYSESYHLGYLFGVFVVGFPIWAMLYYARPDLRRKILITSLIVGIFGPLSEFWYTVDYWHPQNITGSVAGFEDYLFGFFAGGITSVLYEELYGYRLAKRHISKRRWQLLIAPVLLMFCIIFNTLWFIGFNSIYASVASFMVAWLIMLWYRNDLLMDSVVSGFTAGSILFLGYMVFLTFFPESIERWWELKNISGFMLNGVPLEELLWAFSFGLIGGPMYEFFSGYRVVRIESVD